VASQRLPRAARGDEPLRVGAGRQGGTQHAPRLAGRVAGGESRGQHRHRLGPTDAKDQIDRPSALRRQRQHLAHHLLRNPALARPRQADAPQAPLHHGEALEPARALAQRHAGRRPERELRGETLPVADIDRQESSRPGGNDHRDGRHRDAIHHAGIRARRGREQIGLAVGVDPVEADLGGGEQRARGRETTRRTLRREASREKGDVVHRASVQHAAQVAAGLAHEAQAPGVADDKAPTLRGDRERGHGLAVRAGGHALPLETLRLHRRSRRRRREHGDRDGTEPGSLADTLDAPDTAAASEHAATLTQAPCQPAAAAAPGRSPR